MNIEPLQKSEMATILDFRFLRFLLNPIPSGGLLMPVPTLNSSQLRTLHFKIILPNHRTFPQIYLAVW